LGETRGGLFKCRDFDKTTSQSGDIKASSFRTKIILIAAKTSILKKGIVKSMRDRQFIG
jgi:hypothetical protein